MDSFADSFCWFLGVLAAISFGVNLLPQFINAIMTKETGLTYGFFVLAYIGNIGSSVFVFWTNLHSGVWQWPLYGNYLTATILTTALFIMRIRYGK